MGRKGETFPFDWRRYLDERIPGHLPSTATK